MPVCDRHRLGGPDRLRGGPVLLSAWASTWSASTTTCGAYFFGDEASTAWNASACCENSAAATAHCDIDIRDGDAIERLFRAVRQRHRAGRPHRRAALARLGRARAAHRLHRQRQRHAEPARGDPAASPGGACSSSRRPTRSTATRRTACRSSSRTRAGRSIPSHAYCDGHRRGRCRIDQIDCTQLFGASKVAADVLVQEYGRYFGMRTGCFRGGCLTGPAHSGAQLHGFLAT